MPTEELENELRRMLAREAADIQYPEQAGQRLLARNYRPGGRHRRLAAGITAATAATAVALALGLSGVFSSAVASGTGTVRTAAFTLVKYANGTATLTLNLNVLVEPSILQSDLQQDGIPAIVTTGQFCSSDPAPPGFNQVTTGAKTKPPTFTIIPAAMPAGTELSFGNFQVPGGAQTEVALIDTNSYTCSSSAPTLSQSPAADFVLSLHAPGEASGSKSARP